MSNFDVKSDNGDTMSNYSVGYYNSKADRQKVVKENRVANFTLGYDKPSYLSNKNLAELGDFGSANRHIKQESQRLDSNEKQRMASTHNGNFGFREEI